MAQGECHCGNIRFEVTADPAWLTNCNCSMCFRLGALWGHVPVDAFRLLTPDAGMIRYVHGDQLLAVRTCTNCGCTTHYDSIYPERYPTMGVNFRMLGEDEVNRFRIRRFDGAETWQFLDEP